MENIKKIIASLSLDQKVEVFEYLYTEIAGRGINGDTELAHINKEEAELLKSIGGAGTGSVTLTSGTNTMSLSNALLNIASPVSVVGNTLINTTGTANTAIGNSTGNVTVTGATVTIATLSGSNISIGSTTSNSTVSLNGNRLQNVGTATAGTDAVNLNQLNALTASSNAKFTNFQTQLTHLQNQNQVNEKGIAGVSAMSNIPSLSVSQQYNFGLGIGSFSGNTALALGGNWRIKENLIGKISASVSDKSYVTGIGLALGF